MNAMTGADGGGADGGGSGGGVLRRKVGAMRAGAGDPATPDVAKAVRQGCAKAAQDLLGMPLRVAQLRIATLTLAELPEHLADDALMLLLGGPGHRLGLLILAPEVMAALIEMQMLGRVGQNALVARRPTRTDAAMCAGFVDRWLAETEAELTRQIAAFGARRSHGAPLPDWQAGYRYNAYLDDPRPLGLMLEDTDHRSYRIAVEMGDDPCRRGEMTLIVPVSPDHPATVSGADAHPIAPGPSAPAPSDAVAWGRHMTDVVLGASATLEAVLCHMTLPLSAALALRAGAVLALPQGAIDRVEISTLAGRVHARGKLGQVAGFRAVRLHPARDQPGEDRAGLPPYAPDAAARTLPATVRPTPATGESAASALFETLPPPLG